MLAWTMFSLFCHIHSFFFQRSQGEMQNLLIHSVDNICLSQTKATLPFCWDKVNFFATAVVSLNLHYSLRFMSIAHLQLPISTDTSSIIEIMSHSAFFERAIPPGCVPNCSCPWPFWWPFVLSRPKSVQIYSADR